MTKVVAGTLAVLLLGGAGLAQIIHTHQETPAPAQEVMLTEKQKEHSKLYKDRGLGKKLRDLTSKRDSQEVKTDIDIISPPPIPMLSPGGATSTASGLENLACEADAVVTGQVKSKSSFPTADETYIFTDYTMSVEEVLKGDPANVTPGGEVTVTRPGGTVQFDGRRFRAIDRSFKPLEIGDRYLLFLKLIPETGAYSAVNSKSSFLMRDNKVLTLTEEQLQGELGGSQEATSFLSGVRLAVQFVNCTKAKGE